MASNRDTPDTPIATWQLPTQGVQQQIAAHQLPLDAFYDALNVCLRSGKVVTRPCMLVFTAGALTDRVTGATVYIKADGSRIPVAGTRTDILQYPVGGPAWATFKGAVTISGAETDLWSFTQMTFGTPAVNYLVGANGKDPLIQWPGTGNASASAGSPPVFKDICTSFARVVGSVGANEIRWGEVNSLSTWPDINSRFLSDTPDAIVGVRNFGTLGLVVYKERSIWMGSAQGGPSSSAFRFELKGWLDGPAGRRAVVDANGVHFYMTVSGRIAMFDGSTHTWVADGIWPVIKADIANASVSRIVGAYDERENVVVFWYPRTADAAGEMSGMVVLNLPFPSAGIPTYAAFPGRTVRPVSAAMALRLADNLDKIMVFNSTGGTVNRSHTLDWGTRLDDGAAITAFWQTGIVPGPDMDLYAATCEPFFIRGAGLGSVTLNLVTSNVLDAAGGTVGTDDLSVDLTQVPVKEYRGFPTNARFFGLKINYTPGATTHPQWLGANLWSRRAR